MTGYTVSLWPLGFATKQKETKSAQDSFLFGEIFITAAGFGL